MQRIVPALIAALALAVFVPLGAVADAAPVNKTDGHPDHIQQEFDDGPASEDKGQGRGNPAGRNGTIKMDGIDLVGNFDNHPHNEPHIGCIFEVDLYGLDEGDTAILEFREWDPTMHQEPILVLDTERDLVGPGGDGAGGAIDLDDAQIVDLEPYFVGEPHPRHGHHVRVDAMITSGDTTYRKVKVFWTGECLGSGGGGGTGGGGGSKP